MKRMVRALFRQMKSEEVGFSAAHLNGLIFMTVVIGVIPFIVYFYQRATGLLPSREDYQLEKYRHGPWYLIELVDIYAMYLISCFLFGLVLYIVFSLPFFRRKKAAKSSLILATVSFFILILFSITIGWTID